MESDSDYDYDNDIKQVVALQMGDSNTFQGEEKTKNAIVEVESAEFISEEVASQTEGTRILQLKVNVTNRGHEDLLALESNFSLFVNSDYVELYKQEGDIFGAIEPGETLSTILQFQVNSIDEYKFVFEDVYIEDELISEEIVFKIDGLQLEEAMNAK